MAWLGCCLALAACTPATPTLSPSFLTRAVRSTSTATPVQRIVEVVPTATLTPTPSPLAGTVPGLAPLCEAAFAQRLAGSPDDFLGRKLAAGSFIAVIHDVVFPERGWQELGLAPGLAASQPDAVQFVACVRTAPALVGKFIFNINGNESTVDALSTNWDLLLVRRSDGKILGDTHFLSEAGAPANTYLTTAYSRAAYDRDGRVHGDPPDPAVLGEWLLKQLANPYDAFRLERPRDWNPSDIRAALWPDRKTLALYSDQGMTLWDLESGRLLKLLVPPLLEGAPIESRADFFLPPDGKSLVVLREDNFPTQYSLTLWDVEGGEKRFTLIERSDYVLQVVISPDSQVLATLEPDLETASTLRLWSLADGALLGKRTLPYGRVGPMALSPDGRTLAFTDDSQAGVILVAWATGESRVFSPIEKGFNPYRLAFSPDGQTLAAWNEEAVSLWEVASGQKRTDLDLQLAAGESVQGLAISPDGKTLAVGVGGTSGAKLALWDTATGARMRVLEANRVVYDETLEFIAFAQDSRNLISVTAAEESGWIGRILRLWAVDGGTGQ
jgi:WD40 repeat protein